MSGIAGVCNFDGAPVDPRLIVSMVDAARHRGPDGRSHWVGGAVGLGHALSATTVESMDEHQPLSDDNSEFVLVLDGRLDNSDELVIALTHAQCPPRSNGDAEIVLQAYRCWGEGFARRLLGDFTVAIWDERRRRLVCARDCSGHRPFYYSWDGTSFRFSSEPQQLFVDGAVSRQVNRGMLAEHLAGQVTSTSDTLFRDVMRLPAAHLLIASESGVQVNRFWFWEQFTEGPSRSDEECAERFRELFTGALRAQVRSRSPIAVMLSGGVDSSSVVCAGSSVLRELGAETPLEAYSLVYPGRACDESPYIDAVTDACQVRSLRFEPFPHGQAYYEAQIARYVDLPDYPNNAMADVLLAGADANGCRVVLTGDGADAWFTGNPEHYADLLGRLRLVALARQVRADRGVPDWEPGEMLWTGGVKPLIPARVKSAARRARGRPTTPPWLREQFCREVELADRVRPARHRVGGMSVGAIASALTSGWRAHTAEQRDRSSAWYGQEFRDPLSSQPLVEFALGLPEHQRRRGDRTKWVLREGLRGVVPDRVLERRDKADFSHAFAEEFRAQGGADLFRSLLVEELGWVDGDRVRSMYEASTQRFEKGEQGFERGQWQLWSILSADRWLRAVGQL